jgi:hypothetical protein
MCSGFVEWLNKWQTLVSGILALIAGGGAVWAVLRQTREQRDQHAGMLERKRLSARAQMPEALSDLVGFVRECVQFVDGRRVGAPSKPNEAIEKLKVAIEFVDTQPAKAIFELVSFYQVHNSRLFSDQPRVGGDNADAQAYYDAAKLFFLTNRLYDYARNQAETVDDQMNPDVLLDELKGVVGIGYYFGNEERYAGAVEKIEQERRAAR